MSAGYTLVKSIPSPFTTLSGKTRGPAVSLGRFRGKPGGPLWMHMDELRGAVNAAGWPKPEQHQKALDELAGVRAELEQANAHAAELAGENETLRTALAAVKRPRVKSEPAALA